VRMSASPAAAALPHGVDPRSVPRIVASQKAAGKTVQKEAAAAAARKQHWQQATTAATAIQRVWRSFLVRAVARPCAVAERALAQELPHFGAVFDVFHRAAGEYAARREADDLAKRRREQRREYLRERLQAAVLSGAFRRLMQSPAAVSTSPSPRVAAAALAALDSSRSDAIGLASTARLSVEEAAGSPSRSRREPSPYKAGGGGVRAGPGHTGGGGRRRSISMDRQEATAAQLAAFGDTAISSLSSGADAERRVLEAALSPERQRARLLGGVLRQHTRAAVALDAAEGGDDAAGFGAGSAGAAASSAGPAAGGSHLQARALQVTRDRDLARAMCNRLVDVSQLGIMLAMAAEGEERSWGDAAAGSNGPSASAGVRGSLATGHLGSAGASGVRASAVGAGGGPVSIFSLLHDDSGYHFPHALNEGHFLAFLHGGGLMNDSVNLTCVHRLFCRHAVVLSEQAHVLAMRRRFVELVDAEGRLPLAVLPAFVHRCGLRIPRAEVDDYAGLQSGDSIEWGELRVWLEDRRRQDVAERRAHPYAKDGQHPATDAEAAVAGLSKAGFAAAMRELALALCPASPICACPACTRNRRPENAPRALPWRSALLAPSYEAIHSPFVTGGLLRVCWRYAAACRASGRWPASSRMAPLLLSSSMRLALLEFESPLASLFAAAARDAEEGLLLPPSEREGPAGGSGGDDEEYDAHGRGGDTSGEGALYKPRSPRRMMLMQRRAEAAAAAAAAEAAAGGAVSGPAGAGAKGAPSADAAAARSDEATLPITVRAVRDYYRYGAFPPMRGGTVRGMPAGPVSPQRFTGAGASGAGSLASQPSDAALTSARSTVSDADAERAGAKVPVARDTSSLASAQRLSFPAFASFCASHGLSALLLPNALGPGLTAESAPDVARPAVRSDSGADASLHKLAATPVPSPPSSAVASTAGGHLAGRHPHRPVAPAPASGAGARPILAISDGPAAPPGPKGNAADSVTAISRLLRTGQRKDAARVGALRALRTAGRGLHALDAFMACALGDRTGQLHWCSAGCVSPAQSARPPVSDTLPAFLSAVELFSTPPPPPPKPAAVARSGSFAAEEPATPAAGEGAPVVHDPSAAAAPARLRTLYHAMGVPLTDYVDGPALEAALRGRFEAAPPHCDTCGRPLAYSHTPREVHRLARAFAEWSVHPSSFNMKLAKHKGLGSPLAIKAATAGAGAAASSARQGHTMGFVTSRSVVSGASRDSARADSVRTAGAAAGGAGSAAMPIRRHSLPKPVAGESGPGAPLPMRWPVIPSLPPHCRIHESDVEYVSAVGLVSGSCYARIDGAALRVDDALRRQIADLSVFKPACLLPLLRVCTLRAVPQRRAGRARHGASRERHRLPPHAPGLEEGRGALHRMDVLRLCSAAPRRPADRIVARRVPGHGPPGVLSVPRPHLAGGPAVGRRAHCTRDGQHVRVGCHAGAGAARGGGHALRARPLRDRCRRAQVPVPDAQAQRRARGAHRREAARHRRAPPAVAAG